MKFYVFPYTQNSKGAIEIAEELQGKRILREGSTYKPKDDHIVINWGASDCPFKQALNFDNSAALNKLSFFDRLKGTGLTPKAVYSQSEATSLNFPIFCRTKLKSRDGAGIVIADSADGLVSAPLYVEGVNKTAEYRIHVGRLPNGEVMIIGSQKKVKKQQTPEMTNVPKDPRVWCGDTCGLVWKVNGQPAVIPPSVTQCVLAAFEKFPELTFGGFDVVYDGNFTFPRAYVIELNSAPMVSPETRRLYGIFFNKYATLANLPTQEQSPLGATAPQPVAAEVAPAAPVSQPEPQPVIKEEVVFTNVKLTQEEVLTKFIKGEISIADLAATYADSSTAIQNKLETVQKLQELIQYVQG